MRCLHACIDLTLDFLSTPLSASCRLTFCPPYVCLGYHISETPLIFFVTASCLLNSLIMLYIGSVKVKLVVQHLSETASTRSTQMIFNGIKYLTYIHNSQSYKDFLVDLVDMEM